MSTARELRRAFDAGFAAAIGSDEVAREDLLAISVGGHPHAIRLGEITGLVVDRPIVQMPSRIPALLGLASSRGAIVPVFDLAALLGLPRATSPRWIAIAARARVGFAFDAFAGHRRATVADIATSTTGPDESEVLRDGDRQRPIIHLASVIEQIEREAERGER